MKIDIHYCGRDVDDFKIATYEEIVDWVVERDGQPYEIDDEGCYHGTKIKIYIKGNEKIADFIKLAVQLSYLYNIAWDETLYNMMECDVISDDGKINTSLFYYLDLHTDIHKA
jgi:hypothetical protein